jgi:putative transposase
MNQIKKGYKFRIYPTQEQKILLDKTFGCAKYVYNNALTLKRESYKIDKTNLKNKDLSSLLTKQLKSPMYSWLTDVPNTCLRQSLINLDDAFKKFFNKETGFPTHKNKYSKKSIRFQDVVFKNGVLKLPKLGAINVKWTQQLPAAPKMATVSLESCGKYYVSMVIDTEVDLLPMTGNSIGTGKSIGIDVGLKIFCYMSDGRSVDNPRYLRNKQKALRRSQRALSRSKENSNRREKKRIAVAKLHKRVSDCRKDFLHKVSTELVRNNDTIVVEDLKIKNMMRNRRFAKSIADASWGEFMRQLEYKSSWYGRTFIKISPNYTSRDCSCCGHRHEVPMALNIREWTCTSCGTTHDRDENAAKNILQKGMNELIPRGTGKLTDVDISGSGLQLIEDETRMDEASIHGNVMCMANTTFAIAQ